jgi:hypothetical protein
MQTGAKVSVFIVVAVLHATRMPRGGRSEINAEIAKAGKQARLRHVPPLCRSGFLLFFDAGDCLQAWRIPCLFLPPRPPQADPRHPPPPRVEVPCSTRASDPGAGEGQGARGGGEHFAVPIYQPPAALTPPMPLSILPLVTFGLESNVLVRGHRRRRATRA